VTTVYPNSGPPLPSKITDKKRQLCKPARVKLVYPNSVVHHHLVRLEIKNDRFGKPARVKLDWTIRVRMTYKRGIFSEEKSALLLRTFITNPSNNLLNPNRDRETPHCGLLCSLCQLCQLMSRTMTLFSCGQSSTLEASRLHRAPPRWYTEVVIGAPRAFPALPIIELQSVSMIVLC
jgi:hypothetical protein